MPPKKPIGIDLGTTFSCIAVQEEENKVKVILNDSGAQTTPSCVAFTDRESLVGSSAMNQCAKNPTNTVFDAKRLIGRKITDEHVQADMKLWPFKVVDGGDGVPLFEVTFKKEKKQFKPEEISSMVLIKLKSIADKYLGDDGPCEAAVITVPAYFNQLQRYATVDAGNIANLRVKAIINEPTAAAIAYGAQFGNDAEKNIFIFDLGGGTFDVSIVKLQGGKFEVVGTSGDTHLGGEDFDNCLQKFCQEEFKKSSDLDIENNARAKRRLRTEAVKAKIILSAANNAEVVVDALFEGEDCNVNITRARFEEICHDYFMKIVPVCDEAMKDTKITKDQISDVVLIGGSTRIPKVQEILQQYFPNQKLIHKINPDEAVAWGAAIHAAKLPEDATHTEVVETLIQDVTPLDQGCRVGAGGKKMGVVIPKNTKYPAKIEKKYTNARDNMAILKIAVLQGESEEADKNLAIGDFKLNIPPKPKGENDIRVIFEIDGNGLLTVSATEATTGEKVEIQIEGQQALTPEEIEGMRERAKANVAETLEFEKRVESLNVLENLIYEVKNAQAKITDQADTAVIEELISIGEDFMKDSKDATSAEINEKIKDIEDYFNPIKAKL